MSSPRPTKLPVRRSLDEELFLCRESLYPIDLAVSTQDVETQLFDLPAIPTKKREREADSETDCSSDIDVGGPETPVRSVLASPPKLRRQVAVTIIPCSPVKKEASTDMDCPPPPAPTKQFTLDQLEQLPFCTKTRQMLKQQLEHVYTKLTAVTDERDELYQKCDEARRDFEDEQEAHIETTTVRDELLRTIAVERKAADDAVYSMDKTTESLRKMNKEFKSLRERYDELLTRIDAMRDENVQLKRELAYVGHCSYMAVQTVKRVLNK